MFGWADRATKAERRLKLGEGEEVSSVFDIGRYRVEIPGDIEQVTYTNSQNSTDPRRTLPNIEIDDGRIIIPIEDLTEQVLARAEPLEIARALWQNEDVRREFLECLAQRWSQEGIGDQDRRAFLALVKEQIHNKSLDHANDQITNLEHSFGRKWNFYNEIHRINDWLRDSEYREKDGNYVQLRYPDYDEQFKIGGKNWEEARNYWRNELAARFPEPPERNDTRTDYAVVEYMAHITKEPWSAE